MLIRLHLLTHSDFVSDRKQILDIKKQFLQSFPQPALLSENEWDLQDSASIPELTKLLETQSNNINVIITAGPQGIAALEALKPNRNKQIAVWTGHRKFADLSKIKPFLNILALPKCTIAEMDFEELEMVNVAHMIHMESTYATSSEDIIQIEVEDDYSPMKASEAKGYLQKGKGFFNSLMGKLSKTFSQAQSSPAKENEKAPTCENNKIQESIGNRYPFSNAVAISRQIECLILNRFAALSNVQDTSYAADKRRFPNTYLVAGAVASAATIGLMFFAAKVISTEASSRETFYSRRSRQSEPFCPI